MSQADELEPPMILWAYSQGIFPMGEEESDEISWFRPDPRAIIPLDSFHISRRLARTIRSERFRVTYDQAFRDVMLGCAEGRPVWITDAMLDAYTRLHELGNAHSVEVWSGERLVGGVYGVQLGAAFMAESKFHRERDASKVALAKLVERLYQRRFLLLEVQYLTEHLARFGATEVSLGNYLRDLRRAVRRSPRFA
jgi:leucyl/phenylalanyl-tRNA--protein transferase